MANVFVSERDLDLDLDNGMLFEGDTSGILRKMWPALPDRIINCDTSSRERLATHMRAPIVIQAQYHDGSMCFCFGSASGNLVDCSAIDFDSTCMFPRQTVVVTCGRL